MHPATLLSLYPTDLFDKKIIDINPKKLKIYVDVKNISRALFVDNIVAEIAHKTDTQGYLDSSIFQSTIFYSSWWKEYCRERGFQMEMYFCVDNGPSCYHRDIDKRYKENRKIARVNLPFYYNDLEGIRRKNFDLSHKICNSIPSLYFFYLQNLESDFVPYYLITRKFREEKDTVHIICSGDKDLYQCLIDNNVFVLGKSKLGVSICSQKNYLHKYLDLEKKSLDTKIKKIGQIKNINVEKFSLLMALVGDTVDCVEGISSLGPIKALDIVSNDAIMEKYFGSYDSIVDRLIKEESILLSKEPSDNKYVNKIIEQEEKLNKSFKLISFEMLCKWLEKKASLKEIETLKYFDNILSKNNFEIISDKNVFKYMMNQLPDNKITDLEINRLYL